MRRTMEPIACETSKQGVADVTAQWSLEVTPSAVSVAQVAAHPLKRGREHKCC